MDVIFNWVKNIVIYMILNTIVMNLLGNKSYKKYVSIVSGMILVLIVILPIIRMVELDRSLDYFMLSNNLSVEASNFKYDLNTMEEKQKDAVFDEYEKKMRTQVEEILKEDGVSLMAFQITFDQNASNPTFGEILGMNITVGVTGEEEPSSQIPSVDKIEIGSISIDEPKGLFGTNSIEKSGKQSSDLSLKELPSPLEIKLKKRLSDFYYIEPDNINISIQGG